MPTDANRTSYAEYISPMPSVSESSFPSGRNPNTPVSTSTRESSLEEMLVRHLGEIGPHSSKRNWKSSGHSVSWIGCFCDFLHSCLTWINLVTLFIVWGKKVMKLYPIFFILRPCLFVICFVIKMDNAEYIFLVCG